MERVCSKKTKNHWFKKEYPYHIMVWMGIAFLAVFSYIPMAGIIIAFKNYRIGTGILGSPWNNFAHFISIFEDFYMLNALTNTVGIFLLSMLIEFPVVIAFALLLNEINNITFKKIVQTVSYLPHFISWTIMAIILDTLISPSRGIINQALIALGFTENGIYFLGIKEIYWLGVVIASLWKGLGWSSIVYLAVITGIDESLYEAAKIDGAGRFARMRYITLPSLRSIICIRLILSVGSMVNTGFDQAYFLNNPMNYEKSLTLSYYIYEIGLIRGNFGYSTAVGLLLSIVSALLMLFANGLVKKINGEALF